MVIQGTFKDLNNNTITVKIYNIDKTGDDIDIDESDWIRFSDNPVTISTDCDDSFTHIIKKKCTIELITRRWMGEYLFANNSTSIVVNVYRTIGNTTTCLFAGFVTPNSFNQGYANAWETIQINCIDNLGAMEYRTQTDNSTWEQLRAESRIRTFKYLLQQMSLNDTTFVIDNLPEIENENTVFWVETGYERVAGTDGSIKYYISETQAKQIDNSKAVTTTNTRTGNELTPTYIQSEETVIYNGILYYKKYAYVTVNGEQVKTDDWILGDEATDLLPTVVDYVDVLDGWTYGAQIVPFQYYEHFRVDFVMSDGSVKSGYDDTIGSQIPETPSTTTLGSYYEFRQGDDDDLDEDDTGGTVIYYYKNYAWIIMTVFGQTREYKTGDWVRGNRYIPQQSI